MGEPATESVATTLHVVPVGDVVEHDTSAPGCPYCDSIQPALIGPQRTIEVLPGPFAVGVNMLWALEPDAANTPDTYTCRVRECLDCSRSWNEAAA